jgi:hypothetical protein
MSTKTGFAPASAIISPVAMNVNGDVTTSSPRPMPYAISAISNVSVPLDAPMQCLAPTYSASLRSSSRHSAPRMNCPWSSTACMRRFMDSRTRWY